MQTEANNKEGIKETKELLVGLNKITILLAGALKDGFQATDAAVVFDKLKNDPELSAQILAAYNDIEKVSSETKDLTIKEAFELVALQGSYLPDLIKAIKK